MCTAAFLHSIWNKCQNYTGNSRDLKIMFYIFVLHNIGFLNLNKSSFMFKSINIVGRGIFRGFVYLQSSAGHISAPTPVIIPVYTYLAYYRCNPISANPGDHWSHKYSSVQNLSTHIYADFVKNLLSLNTTSAPLSDPLFYWLPTYSGPDCVVLVMKLCRQGRFYKLHLG